MEFKITLLHTKPPVYRTIQIQKDATFKNLHYTIQAAFNWHNAHLHMFSINDEEIGNSEFDEFEEDNTLEESEILLSQKFVFEKQKCIYLYDFGDSWEHQIVLDKFIDAKNTHYPKCIRGARNTPPEDCGGAWGFEEFKEIMSNQKHPEYEDMCQWYDGVYDPLAFDIQSINGALANPQRYES